MEWLMELEDLGPAELVEILDGVRLVPASSEASADNPLGISNDAQAVRVWLEAKAKSPNTFDDYRREAFRLLVWQREHGFDLKGMTVKAVHAFYDHLASPPPHWIRPKKAAASDVLLPTQTLLGPLAPSSIAQTRRVLASMCGYLQAAGYLRYNVFKLSRQALVVQEDDHSARTLQVRAWGWLWDWVCAQQGSSRQTKAAAARTRWLIALLYHTGIRRAEVVSASMNDFIPTETGWILIVTGKGTKRRKVSVNTTLLDELRRYRIFLGLAALPSPSEESPLASSINLRAKNSRLTARSINLIIKAVADQSSQDCDDEHIAAQIGIMTTHWLRHTNATHRLAAGAGLVTTQDELGHSDPKTTRIYTHPLDKDRARDAERLADFSNNLQG